MEQHIATEVGAPVERVWAVLSDAERWPEWTESVTRVELLDRGLHLGARARIAQPRIPTTVWTVTEVDDGHGFVWESRGPGVLTTARHRVDDLGGGRSRVTLSVSQEGWLGSVMGRFYRGLTERYLAMEAAGLRARAESDWTPPATP